MSVFGSIIDRLIRRNCWTLNFLFLPLSVLGYSVVFGSF